MENGAPGKIRTPDPLIRSQVLYPAELPVPERPFKQQLLGLCKSKIAQETILLCLLILRFVGFIDGLGDGP